MEIVPFDLLHYIIVDTIAGWVIIHNPEELSPAVLFPDKYNPILCLS